MSKAKRLKFIDLFCGIGGFRIAAERLFAQAGINCECVFSCDIDPKARLMYSSYFGDEPSGDISQVASEDIPDHDILFAGFPCQPFSIIGDRKGFADTRGTLFFEISRILEAKKPEAFLLENVKQLAGHNKGKTLRVILETLKELGYFTSYKILNLLDYGLPQKRERVFIVGFNRETPFVWPEKAKERLPLSSILDKSVDPKYYASPDIQAKRRQRREVSIVPSIWHENKSGNISAYPYSCALRAGASYNYLLVNGERRLTPREMFRLQGFPDDYKIVVSDAQARKQAGNAVPVNLAKAVLGAMLPFLLAAKSERK